MIDVNNAGSRALRRCGYTDDSIPRCAAARLTSAPTNVRTHQYYTRLALAWAGGREGWIDWIRLHGGSGVARSSHAPLLLLRRGRGGAPYARSSFGCIGQEAGAKSAKNLASLRLQQQQQQQQQRRALFGSIALALCTFWSTRYTLTQPKRSSALTKAKTKWAHCIQCAVLTAAATTTTPPSMRHAFNARLPPACYPRRTVLILRRSF